MSDSDDNLKYSSYQSRNYVNSTQNPRFSQYVQANGYADESEDDDFDDDYGYQNEENANGYNGNLERNPSKRVKLKNVAEFGGIGEWGDCATFVLLDVWGERFMQLGRRSLRSEDWDEVAEKVSELTGVDRTETECRNRMDVLKKRYKKEKEKVGRTGRGGVSSKWVFFNKIDMLMGVTMGRDGGGLACGVDSGEYVFMDTGVYLDKSNVFDEMRDSPGVSEMSEDGDDDEEEEEDGEEVGFGGASGSTMRLLADSVMKFGEIYKKIEDSRRTQMVELEKMRLDCQRDLEMEKRDIVERAEAEIAQIREMDEDSDSSVDDLSN